MPIFRIYIKSITRPNLILANLMLGRNPEQREGEQSPWLQVTARPEWPHCSGLGCPRNKQRKFFVPTQTNQNKICFGSVSVCFVKTKNKNFGLFQFVSVFQTYIETTETNRTVLKQTETTLNFLKKNKMCSLSNCFGWSSVCFGSIETLKLSVSI